MVSSIAARALSGAVKVYMQQLTTILGVTRIKRHLDSGGCNEFCLRVRTLFTGVMKETDPRSATYDTHRTFHGPETNVSTISFLC